jgi:hypothetical protein
MAHVTAIAAARQAVLDAAADVACAPADLDVDVAADDWSLDRRSLLFIDKLVHRLQPRCVLELGSGQSTVVLAGAVSVLPRPAALVSVESDPFHQHRTRDMLAATDLCRFVRLVPAHLVARRLHGRYVPTYYLGTAIDYDDALRPACADLILVDGPPLPLGGREGSLYQALHAARIGAVILVDDSRRDSERALLSRVLFQFEGSLEIMNLLGFEKGLAAMVVTRQITAEGPA